MTHFLRTFEARWHVHRLASAGTPAAAAAARDRLVAIGRASIRPLLESTLRAALPPAALDALSELVSDETLGAYAEALGSTSRTMVEAAAAALTRSQRYDPLLLLPLFADARIARARLESILTAQRSRLHPPALVRALPTLGSESRITAFRLLEQLADRAVGEEAARLAGHPDGWIRLHATKLLARAHGEAGREALAPLLADQIPAIRLEALRAVAARHVGSAIPAVCLRLRDRDSRVNMAAVETLISLGDVSAVPHLLEYLKDESDGVRRTAMEVLNQLVTPDAIKDMVSALRDSDWWVHVRAADALGTLGGPRVIDAVIELSSDPDDFIRRFAVEILNLVPDARGVEALIVALDDHDWWVRERAIDALAKAADPRAVEPLLRVLDTDARATALCAKALARFADVRSVEPLCRLAASADADVRREALVALEACAAASLPEIQRALIADTLAREGVVARPSGEHPCGEASALNIAPTETAASEPALPALPAREPAPAIVSAIPVARPLPPDLQRLEPGTLLADRFRVLRRIGGGGFGTVYLVEDVIVREEIVLKILSPHLSLDELMIRRFVQELRLSRRITHRNVIRIHDMIDLRGAQAISMEYFAGRDLGTVLREDGPLPAAHVLGIAAQVADGLVAAHALGIVHRDIKPANLLLGAGDLVKIVDFGLASVGQSTRSRLTQSGMLVGTPEYISPEQINGAEVDGRTDLYSLGVVLYELLTGRPPFQGTTAVNVLFQHLEPNVPPLTEVAPGIPGDVNDLIMRCMAREPVGRPANATAFLGLLERAA